jgi:hypothetical protein
MCVGRKGLRALIGEPGETLRQLRFRPIAKQSSIALHPVACLTICCSEPTIPRGFGESRVRVFLCSVYCKIAAFPVLTYFLRKAKQLFVFKVAWHFYGECLTIVKINMQVFLSLFRLLWSVAFHDCLAGDFLCLAKQKIDLEDGAKPSRGRGRAMKSSKLAGLCPLLNRQASGNP